MQPFRDPRLLTARYEWISQKNIHRTLNLFQSKIIKTFKAEIDEQTELGSFWGAVVSCHFMFLTLRHFYAMIHCRVSIWLVRLWKPPKRDSLKGSKMRFSSVSTPTHRHAFNVTLYVLKWCFSQIVKHNTAFREARNKIAPPFESLR